MLLLKIFQSAFRVGNNEKGFTYLEMLVAITILIFFTGFFSTAIQQLKPTMSDDWLDKYEVENFFLQIKLDFRTVESYEINNNKLCYLENKNYVCYEQRGNRLNRTVNNSGNNFGLLNISTIRFLYNELGIKVEVQKLNGNYYETQIVRWDL